jgi:hypothetical protein
MIVNCGGQQRILAELLAQQPVSNVRVVTLTGASFSKSLANNTGAVWGRGETLFFLDADIVLRTDVIAQARRMLDRAACFRQGADRVRVEAA